MALGQEIINNDKLNAKLPIGLLLVNNKKNLVKEVQHQLDVINTKIALGSRFQGKYVGNGIIKYFQYHSGDYISNANYLKEREKGIYNLFTVDGVKNLPKYYQSKIHEFKNYSVLIVRSNIEEYLRYSIYSINDEHTKYLNCTLISQIKDINQSDKEVEKFISSIHFK